MGHLHNYHHNHRPSVFANLGQKVKQGAEIAVAAKTIFDVGKTFYITAAIAAPIVAGLV